MLRCKIFLLRLKSCQVRSRQRRAIAPRCCGSFHEIRGRCSAQSRRSRLIHEGLFLPEQAHRSEFAEGGPTSRQFVVPASRKSGISLWRNCLVRPRLGTRAAYIGSLVMRTGCDWVTIKRCNAPLPYRYGMVTVSIVEAAPFLRAPCHAFSQDSPPCAHNDLRDCRAAFCATALAADDTDSQRGHDPASA